MIGFLVAAMGLWHHDDAQRQILSASDTACPYGRFYAYRQPLDDEAASVERELRTYCQHESFHCTRTFVQRMLDHPCRTETLDSSTRAVAVLHTLTRYSPASTRIANASHRAFNWAAQMFAEMPRPVREHPYLYLFAGGEAYLMGHYNSIPSYPQQATIFTAEPLWAQVPRRGTGTYGDEPLVPSADEACYLYQPSARFASVPFWQPANESTADLIADIYRTDDERANKVFYFASLHGQSTNLRRRLYELCEPEAGWLCPRELTGAKDGAQHGVLPLSPQEYVAAIANSTFVLIPAGDSPGRISMWDGLRRGVVPVLFSSCTQPHVVYSHRGWLPPDDGASFGVRTWAVLLNQTAVMTEPTYVRDMLNAVSPEQVAAMRAAVAPYIAGFSYHPDNHAGDAISATVGHMLQRRSGSPVEGPPLPPGFEPVCEDCSPSDLRRVGHEV